MPTCCPISRSATTCSPSTASVTANRATIRRFTRARPSGARSVLRCAKDRRVLSRVGPFVGRHHRRVVGRQRRRAGIGMRVGGSALLPRHAGRDAAGTGLLRMERRLRGDARVPPVGRRCDPTVYYAQHSYLFSLFGELRPKSRSGRRRSDQRTPTRTSRWPGCRTTGARPVLLRRLRRAVQRDVLRRHVVRRHRPGRPSALHNLSCRVPEAKTNYGEDGTLLAANSDEDAARMQQLVAVCETVVVESGHDIHYERPKAFAAVDQMASKYSCPSFSAASYSSRACAMSSVTRPSMP